MKDVSISEFIFVILLGILILVVIPYVRSVTGKSMREILLGSGGLFKKRSTVVQTPVKKQRPATNSTKNDITIFASRLVRFASRNGMRTVLPGMIAFNGETARTMALLVAPGGVVGVYCLGFGGTITPKKGAAEWTQHINGETKTIPNPVRVCQEQYRLIRAAMDSLNLAGNLRVVAVFTNTKVELSSIPPDVYTVSSFLEYLSNAQMLREGTLDVKGTADALATLVPMDQLREAAKPRKREKEPNKE
ncbi:MAG: hypothetical protein LUC94_01685 [Clostridiales bacterium]|nr:hypothetical protein [Clostridiales bacterium]